MNPDPRSLHDMNDLRGRAEAIARGSGTDLPGLTPEQIKRLLHELQVHEIELRMQTENLRATQLELTRARDRFAELYDFAPVGYVTLDHAGVIRQANLMAGKLLGTTRSQLANRRFSSFLAPESLHAFAQFKHHLEHDKHSVIELRTSPAINGSVWLHLEGAQADDDDGAPEYRLALVDTSTRRKLEEDLKVANASLEARVEARTRELSLQNQALEDEIHQRRETEDLLQANRAFVQSILDSAPNAIVTFDERGRLKSSNEPAQAMFGYEPEQLAAATFHKLIPEFRPDRPGQSLKLPPTDAAAPPVVICRRADGTAFFAELMLGRFTEHDQPVFTAILTDVTARLQHEAEVRRLQAELVESVEAERMRFGEQLHDDVGQELRGMAFLAHSLETQLPATGSAESDAAHTLAEALERTLQKVRAIARGMVAVDMDEDALYTALDQLVSKTREHYGIDCTFNPSGGHGIPDHGMRTHLFHIAQEAVSNAAEHAHPARIAVELSVIPNRIVLTIRDDGAGFNVAAARHTGLGINIMHHRARLIGAKLSIESELERGTTVQCSVNRETDRGQTHR